MILLLFVSLPYLMAQVKFDTINLDKSEKTVKSLINAKLDDLKKYNVKKVIIFGCKGEFILSKTTAPSAWEGKDLLYYEKEQRTKTLESNVLDQKFCVELTSKLLDSVTSLLKSVGIEVVAMDEWQSHPVYQEMTKIMMDYDKDQGTKYGMISQTVTIRTLTVPAYGYRLEPENLIKMMKYQKLKTQDCGKILEDKGAQAFCNISFKVDGATRMKPSLNGLEIIFETGMKKYDMGTKDKDGNKVFMYSLTSSPVLGLKDILEYQNSIYKDRYIDTKLYANAILKMQSYILSMFQEKLKAVITQ